MLLSPDDLTSRLDVALAAARAAGAVLLRHYAARDALAVEQKGVNDFVSNADREAEDVIAGHLLPGFPQDVFLGEETGLSGGTGDGPVWCVDPLDGTTNFLKGAHNWCVSIGLWHEGAPVLGVLYDALRDEMFAGIVGQGATCNGVPIHVSSVARLDGASLGIGHNRRVPVADLTADLTRLLATGAGIRQVGAGALMLAYVAAGRVDAYVERHMWPWDAVAGLALILAAGGVSTDYPGTGLAIAAGGPVLAGAPDLVQDIRQALA